MDPGTRGNSWTLVIATRKRIDALRTKQIVARVTQWAGSKAEPLSPEKVLEEIAGICKAYRVDVVRTDQYSADALKDLAYRHGLTLRVETITAPRKVELFEDMRAKIAQGDIELPADSVLRSDLLSVRKRVTQSGITFELPRTADGRHADYAPALALVLAQHVDAPAAEVPRPKKGTPEYAAWLAELQEKIWLEREEEELRRQTWSEENANEHWIERGETSDGNWAV
jgi:hypothetical protein